MLNKIILASKSKVRKEILDKNKIPNEVKPSNVDEDLVKKGLIKEKAKPEIISKNLAELKANKVSLKSNGKLILGADSVIDLNGELISKPINRKEAIKTACSMAHKGDILLIAGKGHEKIQVFKNKVVLFNDVKIAKLITNRANANAYK